MLKNLNHIRYHRLVFSVNDYFLCHPSKLDAGINYCTQCPENTQGALNPFPTLLIDLTKELEFIRGEIYHRTLAEINSFVTNQNFEHRILKNIPKKTLAQFMGLFDVFAAHKKIRKAERFRLNAYNTAGVLAISYIQQNEQLLCVNFYRLTQQRATNLYSFSPHDIKNVSASHLGRAHRALHWLDILAFKDEGANYYDFCGLYTGTTDQALLNVNAFKEQFTKNRVMEYSGVIYKNPLLRFILKLLRK